MFTTLQINKQKTVWKIVSQYFPKLALTRDKTEDSERFPVFERPLTPKKF